MHHEYKTKYDKWKEKASKFFGYTEGAEWANMSQLQRFIEKQTSITKTSKLVREKVFVENDANSAAWAEYKIGASKGSNVSVMLTLGTGVGGGIIINDKILKGKSGAAGEMHFMMSRKKERKCI